MAPSAAHAALRLWAASTAAAGGWLDWLTGGGGGAGELQFDVSGAPPLAGDTALFPEEYRRRMRWGTYRPGAYFGVKGQHAGSLMFGLAWGSPDGKVLRHDCKAGELESFGWLEHDGESYGLQELEDKALGLKLATTFVKDVQRPEQGWHARVEAGPHGAKPRAKALFLYFGVEARGDFVREAEGLEDVGGWQQREDGSWRSSVRLQGTDKGLGAYRATVNLVVEKDVNASEAPKPWRRAAAQVAASEDMSGTEQAKTGVWDGAENILRRLQRAEPRKPRSFPEGPPEQGPANWWAAQLLLRPAERLRLEVHVSLGEADAEEADVAALAAKASEAFWARLEAAFPAKAPFEGGEQRKAAAAAVSGLLGGIGHFRGRLLAKDEAGELVRLPEAQLLSGVPSRSFFPRGFLWDEGFHGLLLVRWQPRIFLDVLAHWLELQQASGWIPREVPLGAEQEARVPYQFLAQEPGVANPPSFLLPLAWLVSTALAPASPASEALARQAGLKSPAELRELVVAFGAAALPRLAAWYAFLSRSQQSSHEAGCFKWAGRSAAHCLASGLDDYPRGLMINEDECHLDLHSWMTLFAGTLAAFCRQLAGGLKDSRALCEAPDWAGRARALNRSMHEVFTPPMSARAPLADYMGRQPVSKGGRVVLVPPWRTDGRCGPQFPSADGRPGECDPYGGGPCCSPSGWCGGSPDFCDCPHCVRAVKLEDRKKEGGLKTQPAHSPHLGYVSLFPVMLGLLPWHHPRAQQLLEALQPLAKGDKKKSTLWSPHGVMSLSRADPLFGQGENYWRGKIWGNLNFLTISALGRVPPGAPDAVAEKLQRARASLRDGFVASVLGTLRRQRYFFENFDPDTGEGKGTAPFTGWTTLVVLVMSEQPVQLDLAELLGQPPAAAVAEL